MFSSICTNTGNVYAATISNNCIEIVAHDYSERYVQELGTKFAENFKFKYTLGSKANNVSWYKIANVGNHYSHLNTVFLFIVYKSQRSTLYECSERDGQSKIIEWTNYNLSASIQNVSLAAGPSILSLDGAQLRLLSPLYDIDFTYSLNLVKEISNHILFFQCVDHVHNCKGFSVAFLIIVQTTDMVTNTTKVRSYASLNEWYDGKSYNRLHPIESHVFFPSTLRVSVTAIQVNFKSQRFLPDQLEQRRNIDDLPWLDNHTMLCTETELMIFHKGILKQRCQIPFSDISKIMTIKYDLENFTALQSASSGVCCCICKWDDETLECVQSWAGAQCAFFGDFRNNGSKQLLLLYDDSFEFWQDGCLLIDLHCLGQNLEEEGDEIPNEHAATIINGLSKVVLSAKAAVAEAQYEIARKNAAIHDLFTNINQHMMCKPTSASNDSMLQNNLLDIILNTDDLHVTCEKEHDKAEQFAIDVKGSWKTFVFSQLVLGWAVQNVSRDFVTNLQVTVVPSGETVEYVQKVYNHNCTTLHTPDSEKSYLDPGEEWTVAVAMPMPVLNMDSIHMSFIISWSIGKEYTSKLFFAQNEVLPCQQRLIHVTLSTSDMLQKKQETECTAIQQLMSYRVTQERVLLSLSHKDSVSDLELFDENVLKNSSLQPPILKQHQQQKYFIFEDPKSPLCGVNVSARSQKQANMEIDAYVRNTAEGVFLVQWLYTIFSGQVVINAKELSEKETSVLSQKLLMAMKDEIELMSTISTEADNEGIFEQEANMERISLKKDTYTRFRKLLAKREFIADSLMVQLSDAQNG